MKITVWGMFVMLFLVSCGNGKKETTSPNVYVSGAMDSLQFVPDSVNLQEEKVADRTVRRTPELFDDFIFNYASDEHLQKQRTVFPLPYYNGEASQKITAEEWKYDELFANQSYYTLLFDNEEEMELVGDTSLISMQAEWIYLATHMVKRYSFERVEGEWMLEAINLRHMEKGAEENFVSFYAKFATDSLFQSQHIRQPLKYVTVDPDDEFSILETTLDLNQWFAFAPLLPTEKLSNICYGQQNEDNSRKKILKVNGIGNGYANIFYFRKHGGEWELYKYEDTSI
ncbi:MAG: DUF4348 domain-containing protein [Bacteroides sp.]|nr:DUF4348 domain-containing protein [Bacteroides sp.]